LHDQAVGDVDGAAAPDGIGCAEVDQQRCTKRAVMTSTVGESPCGDRMERRWPAIRLYVAK
jgi:hypothetical protein